MMNKPTAGQVLLLLCLLCACQAAPLAEDKPDQLIIEHIPPGMSQVEVDTLSSLEQIDAFPLYTMVYSADYDYRAANPVPGYSTIFQDSVWGCSLFAVVGDPEEMLFGRNFDWDFSPGLLLFTDPPGGYASVSMVDLSYLGFGEDGAFGIIDLPLSERTELLEAPFIPFDGMNETGLVIGMAAVPSGGMEDDPAKDTIDSVMVIRIILDEAATIEEAIEIIKTYNIDMGSGPPLHYLVADNSGRSALIEFSGGEVKVINNSDPWQQATNFLVSEAGVSPDGMCWRYGLISRRLFETKGKLNSVQAMELLEDVSQENTQWSVVYGLSDGDVKVVMGRHYSKVHTFGLDPE